MAIFKTGERYDQLRTLLSLLLGLDAHHGAGIGVDVHFLDELSRLMSGLDFEGVDPASSFVLKFLAYDGAQNQGERLRAGGFDGESGLVLLVGAGNRRDKQDIG
jgi:hypothetical protein